MRDRFDIPRVGCKVSNAAKQVCSPREAQGFGEFDLQSQGVIGQDCPNMSLDEVQSPWPLVLEFAVRWKTAMKPCECFLFL